MFNKKKEDTLNVIIHFLALEANLLDPGYISLVFKRGDRQEQRQETEKFHCMPLNKENEFDLSANQMQYQSIKNTIGSDEGTRKFTETGSI